MDTVLLILLSDKLQEECIGSVVKGKIEIDH